MIGVTWEVAHLRFDESHDLAALIRLALEWQRQCGKPGPPDGDDDGLELNRHCLLRCTGRTRADWASNCLERLKEQGLVNYALDGLDSGAAWVRLLPDGVDLLCWRAEPEGPRLQA